MFSAVTSSSDFRASCRVQWNRTGRLRVGAGCVRVCARAGKRVHEHIGGAGAKGEDARRRVVERCGSCVRARVCLFHAPPCSVAPNEALSVIVRGMQTAHTVYGVPTYVALCACVRVVWCNTCWGCGSAVILFIVSPAEFNTVDQRRLECVAHYAVHAVCATCSLSMR